MKLIKAKSQSELSTLDSSFVTRTGLLRDIELNQFDGGWSGDYFKVVTFNIKPLYCFTRKTCSQ